MWDNVKQVIAPGALDPLTKELIYITVTITNNCPYCIASHTASARAKGMTETIRGITCRDRPRERHQPCCNRIWSPY